MTYKQIVQQARDRGLNTERAMESSINSVSELLESMKDTHPEVYKQFLQKTHEDLFGPHYNDEFANEAVSALEYTDENGKHRTGPHWTKQEVITATQGKTFPNGTTDCDKYVAYNATYADFCKKFDEEDILDIAYLFFFADEDWKGKGKIWTYMHSNNA